MTLDEPQQSHDSPGPHNPGASVDDWVAELPYTAVFASDDVGRRKLEAILGRAAFPIIASTECITELLSACEGQRVDVAVLWSGQLSSAWQPEVRRLATEMPTVKIIVTAAADSGRGVRRALRAGASGFVPKSDVDGCLLATIHAAIAGQVCVPCGAQAQLARPALSHREKKILELIALGYTNNEIAGRLFLAESTVKTHVSTCFRKLGVATRAEAAAVVLDPLSAIELGVVPTLVGDSDRAYACIPPDTETQA
jgi:DNA-binding NarL/FixJ family response regulator